MIHEVRSIFPNSHVARDLDHFIVKRGEKIEKKQPDAPADEVDDVDEIAAAVDVRRHLRIPPRHAASEVHTRIDELLYGDLVHENGFASGGDFPHARRDPRPASDRPRIMSPAGRALPSERPATRATRDAGLRSDRDGSGQPQGRKGGPGFYRRGGPSQ